MQLTKERLDAVLEYSPDTGVFIWKAGTYARRKVGIIAGGIKPIGYRVIGVDGKYYGAHRLAFLAMTGAWPTLMVDHIDGNKENNKWSNLRDVSCSVNQRNRHRARKDSAYGMLGVSKSLNKFKAVIRSPGKQHYLGTFSTKEEAQTAYLNARNEICKEFD